MERERNKEEAWRESYEVVGMEREEKGRGMVRDL